MKIKISLFATLLISFLGKAQDVSKNNDLKTSFNESETIFEGHSLNKKTSVLTANKTIFTLLSFKVTKIIKGIMPSDSIIKIEIDGGTVTDPETGMIMDNSYSAHGNGFITSSNAIYYLNPKNERNNNRLKRMIDISNPNKIVFNDIESYNQQPYTKLVDLYAELSNLSGKQLIVEKKSLVVEEREKSKIEPIIPYEVRLQNFNTLISKKTEQYLLNKSNNLNKISAQDVTLQVTGTTVTGTTVKYLEFDVNIKSSNSASYLDNMPVWLTFNPVVFGSNVVAANNVTVTNGSSFNNTQYLSANSNMADQTANTFAFSVGTDYTLSNPTRVNITPTYKLLAHVKMKIVQCGNATVNLSNASTALNAAFYTTTSTASSSAFVQYTSLLYNGTISSNFPCSATIIDFNTPINGGLNEVLTISGYGFGASRGNGQVKFRNADKFGFPYINKLDNLDYISWNDTLIKLKFPSTIDTISNLEFNTPGSGNFKVITNNATDSTISGASLSAGATFSVYFSIYNTRPSVSTGITTAQKLKANLYKSVPVTGGYVIRLDTSISNHPDRKGCVIKAIKKWVCATTINIKLGNDTTMRNYGAYDKICNLFFDSPAVFPTVNTVAETKVNSVICTTGVATRYIYDFDIRVNKSKNFFCDTTGATLPIGEIDFYEVVLHEIGHGIGLMHVMDSAAVMYYRTLGNQTFTISGSSRRDLNSFASDIDAGDMQLATSLNNITGSCGAQDMVQINSQSCSGGPIGIKELLQSNFNMLVYPNPSTYGDVNISFDGLENSKPKLELYNVLGEKIFEDIVINDSNSNNHFITKINVNELSNGIYILNIVMGNNKASYKIVKQ